MMAALNAPSSGAASTLLFLLRGSLYGVEAFAVREVLPAPGLTSVGEAPPLVMGIVNLRGKLVPIVDLPRAIALSPQPLRASDSLIVLERDGQLAAILVDEVCYVTSIGTEAVEAAPFGKLAVGEMLPQSGAPDAFARPTGLIAGLARMGDQIAQLLRLDTVFGLARLAGQLELSGLEELTSLRDESALAPIDPSDQVVLTERARVLSQPLQTEFDGETALGVSQLAAVSLGGETFALDLGVVREFSPLGSLAPVPCSPNFIVGLMNLRGETLTLIDIRPALGLPTTSAEDRVSHVVVVEWEGQRLGVLVDEVLDVFSVRAAEMTSAPPTARGDGDFLTGTTVFRDRMLGLLDLPRLLEVEVAAMATG